jgi:hypothetical protein
MSSPEIKLHNCINSRPQATTIIRNPIGAVLTKTTPTKTAQKTFLFFYFYL